MLWLLMLALPLQALASVAQLSCGIGERQPGQSLRHASAVHDTGHAACGACATCCCASAVLPNSNAAPATWDGTGLQIAMLPACRASFIPDRPERPPRNRAS